MVRKFIRSYISLGNYNQLNLAMKHSRFHFLNILFFSRKQLLHAQQTNLVAQMQWIQANLSGLGPSSSILPPSSFASSPSFMKGHYLF